jgi:hypothetical protein
MGYLVTLLTPPHHGVAHEGELHEVVDGLPHQLLRRAGWTRGDDAMKTLVSRERKIKLSCRCQKLT